VPPCSRRTPASADTLWGDLSRHNGDTHKAFGVYDDLVDSYNARGAIMATNYVMKVSSNGQVSIPAEARARWNADEVVVVDLGDRVVLRPLPADPVGELRGKYKRRGPSSERSRRLSRNDDAARSRQR
jgi:AbrB family looped-hinge helix DNA binding protein